MLVDLNVPWPQKSYEVKPTALEIDQLKKTLITLHTLGYTHVVLNFTVPHNTKFPKDNGQLNPIKVSLLQDVISLTRIKIYTRITVVVDDPSKGQSLTKVSSQFDIVAAMPISEKGLTLATTNLDIDLLTFEYGNRLPAFLKHKNICSCVNGGVKLEIVYANALRDMQTKRQFIINAKNVIRASRSRGIVVSSGAESPLECRNVLGVSSVIKFMGLRSDRCSKAMTELASLVLLNGRLRNKSHKQTVVVGGAGNTDIVNDVLGIDSKSLIKVVKRRRSQEGDPFNSDHTDHTEDHSCMKATKKTRHMT
ncbi:RNA-binding RNA processing protein RPP1 Ecym_3212 [Eremothecium cymbalariae DBVPG|uniref:Uncharacterized protein n=1 Tax=Eremothecium cymbalariae (strain CBS 270.75 / DBVPG 7215 / KCTC 17166 / NRRL Y-17582) TaxID=931890 RepID=G8JRE1_ERECY|nr:Hypothetical protein Ecym_3212 [Eremothecium cymbalariae DBVPG\